ncbi:MAG: glycine cleavage T C-terminal barrel domain-containing protein, partial [Caulobacterales bacterium]
WPDLDVQLSSVTEQWAQFAVAGPQSRALAARILPGIDLSNGVFPYMAAAETAWRGAPARIYRLSFSGELAFEIGVPSVYGDAFMRALIAAGQDLGVAPYGTEAMAIMRIEKGHAAGGELNGQVTAGDLGLGKMLSTKKIFIGQALASRPGLIDPQRPGLVGARPVDQSKRIRAGAHFTPLSGPRDAANDLGWISSTAFSPSLNSWITLGFIKGGAGRIGERVLAFDPVRGAETEVEICSPVFVDPEGGRLRG